MPPRPYPEVPSQPRLPELEERVLAYWKAQDLFRASIANRKDAEEFVFYDGPPFANGLPHYGHLLTGYVKDIVPRYWTMKGRYVLRRFGWDCHGLPIEHEIDKQLGYSAPEAIAQLGIAGYNDACRSIVQRYVAQWRETITRLGRWVDFVLADAGDVLARYDALEFVLVDCEKDDYQRFVAQLHLAAGAVVVADNILSHGLTSYVESVRAYAGVESVTLPIGKGLEVSRFRDGAAGLTS